ncbi:MAG: tetratricopeptide repeat protein [Endomicrobia bacterium]|nr:tetratricopeptide repeat protein [Endomicrobiia bacterium]
MKSKLVDFLFYTIIVVSPLVFFTDLTRNPYYFQIVFAQSGMIFLWLVVLLKQKGKIIHYTNPFEKPMLIFYGYAIISWLFSMFVLNHNYHVPQLISDSIKVYGKNFFFMSMFNEGFKKFIFTVTNIILVYFFATNYINKENFKKVYFTLFIVGFFASIYGILQYFGIEIIWPKVLNPFGGRCVSTFGNPNFLSSFLILLFPLMFVEYIYSRSVLMFIFLIIYYCALLSTLTRSSWLGLFVSLVYMLGILFLKERKLLIGNKYRVAILFIFMSIFFLLWPKSPVGGNPSVVERILEIRQAKEVYAPLHQRFLIWLCGWDMIKEKPITGKGWGLFELFYPFYQGKYLFVKELSHRTHANNAHNEIIEIWSQTGTLGLGIYILFLICFFIYSYKIFKKEKNYPQKLFILALSSSVLGMIVDNLLNVTIHFCIPAFLYFFNIGSLASFDESREKKEIYFKGFSKYFVLVIGCLIILRLWLNFLGEINYFKGFKYSKRNELEQALYYLSKANKFQKYEVNNNYELANTYARLKRLKEAIHYYYEALASNCGYDEIHFNLATVYAQSNNQEMAKLHYTQSLFINPLSKEAYMALGSIFLSEIDKNLKSAIKLFEQAVMVFPEEKDFYNNLGYLYIKSNEDYKALKCYEKALKIDPNFEFAKRNYILLSDKLKIKDNIIITYERLFTEMMKDIKENKLSEAESKCYELLKIFPNDYNAKFYLANILFSKNEFEKAAKLYKEIISGQPDNLTVRYNFAVTLVKLQNFTEAEQHLKYILSKQPDNFQARALLDQIKKNF